MSALICTGCDSNSGCQKVCWGALSLQLYPNQYRQKVYFSLNYPNFIFLLLPYVKNKIEVLENTVKCALLGRYRRFARNFCLHLQGKLVGLISENLGTVSGVKLPKPEFDHCHLVHRLRMDAAIDPAPSKWLSWRAEGQLCFITFIWPCILSNFYFNKTK